MQKLLFTYFNLLFLCMWPAVINKVKGTCQGQGHMSRSRSNQSHFKGEMLLRGLHLNQMGFSLPMHVLPSPAVPWAQEHTNPPSTFLHSPKSASQSFLSALIHSSSSKINATHVYRSHVWLFQSHSLAKFCFELSGNSNSLCIFNIKWCKYGKENEAKLSGTLN